MLCATARLARSLRQAGMRADLARGQARWQPPQLFTLDAWLQQRYTEAMLGGAIDPGDVALHVLTPLQEKLLWERVITEALADDAALPLFDCAGMAAAAAEASRLLLEWDIPLPAGVLTEETRHFLRWRKRFRKLCADLQVIDAASQAERQIAALQAGHFTLPPSLRFAGFDRLSPQLLRLRQAMQEAGVAVGDWQPASAVPDTAGQRPCDDVLDECRAAVGWAAQCLARQPQSRLAIVVPELERLRDPLIRLLDDTLHPLSLHPAFAEMPRLYDVSLGDALAAHPLVDSALALLGVATRRFRLAQNELSRLLRDSHVVSEPDACASLELRMRQRMPSTMSLEQCLRLARKAVLEGWGPERLVSGLEALQAEAASWPGRQLPSQWASCFGRLLDAMGWGGVRPLSSHEFQARQAWQECMADFAGLDALLGRMDAGAALSRLGRMVRERIFQAETEGDRPLLVLGMLETLPEALDGLWVLGMNDHVWPPPARPNPLLPAASQRAARSPNADSLVQAEFAGHIHRRQLHSARQVVFSWSRRDGERELRPGPLLAGLPGLEMSPRAETLAERLAKPAVMQWLEDHRAPPVGEGEVVKGGSGLLKAQAICPAWAFYQYRLGARRLDTPVEGLDALDRGNLLHAALESFWRDRDSTCLHTAGETDFEQAIAAAVKAGLRKFSESRDEPLPPAFAALEHDRLCRLLHRWLDYERQRQPFKVSDCEQHMTLELAGISVHLVIDRVDTLPDGRKVVIDYKTGARIEHKNWADARISEPQLPLYAALALAGEQVAAVCFAQVRVGEQKFIGIAAESGQLPDLKGLEEARQVFDAEHFPDWPALLDHWRRSIEAVAAEIRDGEAGVRFPDEERLRDCDVRPLLRIAERKLQLERGEPLP